MEVDPLELASLEVVVAELVLVEVDLLELLSVEVEKGRRARCLGAQIAPTRHCPMAIFDT
jgi:hypothetical protein